MSCWDSANIEEQGRWYYTDSKGNFTYKHERDIRQDEFCIWLDYQRMRCSPPELNTWERFTEEWLRAEGYKQYDFETEDYV